MIRQVLGAFLRDARSKDLSSHSVQFYQTQVQIFIDWYEENCGGKHMEDITPDTIRSYLIHLQDTGHNPGGVEAKYRALRVFLNWWASEDDTFKNPMAKVHKPKVPREPITPITEEQLKMLLSTCEGTFVGTRDRAMMLFLYDTGVRAMELLNLNQENIEPYEGKAVILQGKGGKSRYVFFGQKARRALRTYLKMYPGVYDKGKPVWVTEEGDRLAKKSLQGMLERRGRYVDLDPPPSPHDFRRAFALNMLRAGVDVFSIMRLMGHTTLEMLHRYIAQNTDDLEVAHANGSPVDKMFD